jgi:putative ABC transport system permease protein
MAVSFTEPASPRALDEVRRMPGVLAVEPYRAVPARLRFGHRSRHTSVTGVPADARLNRVVDASSRPVLFPPDGLVLSEKLAGILGAEVGDRVTLEVLEGRRPVVQVPIQALVDDSIGINVYMELTALRRLMGEGDTLSGAYLLVDHAALEELYARLKSTPRVAGVLRKEAAVESFQETFADMMGSVTGLSMVFAGIIAFGVVYNSARISLSERSRELASLRVLGLTRAEISYILLGELALTTLVAIPLGLALGYGLAAVMVADFDTEVWRLPLVVSSRTYALAAITVLVATVISALIVRRKLDRLDLVEVLKTRE